MTAPAAQAPPRAKPLPDLAAWLVWQHQQDQEQLANKTALALALLWPMLQFAKLDETSSDWTRAVTSQIETAYRVSEKLSHEMASGVRWSWLPGEADPMPFIESAFPVAEVRTTMRVTGPIAVKKAMPAPEAEAMDNAKFSSSGAGANQASNGGRSQVIDFVQRAANAENARSGTQKRSRQEIGYARVTDGNPCAFCALLASQGAIYLSQGVFDSSNSKIREAKGTARQERRAFLGDGIAKVHDNCKCSMRPVFSTRDGDDARAKFFLKQWNNMDKSGLSPKDQIKEFRRVYVPPEPYKVAPPVDLNAVRANKDALSSLVGADAPVVAFYRDAISKLG